MLHKLPNLSDLPLISIKILYKIIGLFSFVLKYHGWIHKFSSAKCKSLKFVPFLSKNLFSQLGTRTWIVRYKWANVLFIHGMWFSQGGMVHLNMHQDYEHLLWAEADIFTTYRTNTTWRLKCWFQFTNPLIDQNRKGTSCGTRPILDHTCTTIDILCFLLYIHPLPHNGGSY